jgi:peptidyl-prolyl cis-trans isomerase SurA
MLLTRLYASAVVLAASALIAPASAQTTSAPALVDAIVAVVGTEPITAFELNQRVQVVARQNGVAVTAQLRSQVLDALVNERAQAQAAVAEGISVTQADVDQAEQTIAAQNQLDVAGLHKQIEKEGLTVNGFRRQLLDQLLVQRAREREVSRRVTVTPADIDQFLQAQAQPGPMSLQVAHIVVTTPEAASEAVVAQAKATAQGLQARAKAGEDFAALARQYSQSGDAAQGGDLGLRAQADVPPLFVQAVANVAAGEVGELVRSGAGWHVVKLLKRERAQPVMTVVQTRARHILLRAEGDAQQRQAVTQLEAVRQRLVAGTADFAQVATQISQDGSAPAGGDLGWARPGMFVPEFEAAMDRLDINGISPPVVTRFGVHLIQVLERARAALTPEEQKTAVTNVLREQKSKEVLTTWARDVRARAYVEIREPQAE